MAPITVGGVLPEWLIRSRRLAPGTGCAELLSRFECSLQTEQQRSRMGLLLIKRICFENISYGDLGVGHSEMETLEVRQRALLVACPLTPSPPLATQGGPAARAAVQGRTVGGGMRETHQGDSAGAET